MLFSNASGHLKSIHIPTLYDITKEHFRAHLKKDGFEWYLDNMNSGTQKSLIDDMGIGISMHLIDGFENVSFMEKDASGNYFHKEINFDKNGWLWSVIIDKQQSIKPQYAYLIDDKIHYEIFFAKNEKGGFVINRGTVNGKRLTDAAAKENHQDIIDMIEKKRQELTPGCRKIMDERKAKFEALKARLGI